MGDKVLFDPSWGTFDLACGSEILSVYGGPSDWSLYRSFMDIELPKKEVPPHIKKINSNKQELNDLYTEVRDIRESRKEGNITLNQIYSTLSSKYPNEWLLKIEILETCKLLNQENGLMDSILHDLNILCDENSDIKDSIERGIALIHALYTT